jgi:hypothetical protein
MIFITNCQFKGSMFFCYPIGPQLNVSKSDLVGWNLCWNASYAAEIDKIAVVQNCTDAPYLLMGCGPDPEQIQLLSVEGTNNGWRCGAIDGDALIKKKLV